MAQTLDFPNLKDIDRLAELKKWDRLYYGEHYKVFGIKDYFVDSQDKEKLLYIAVNISSIIADYFADMVSGGDVKIKTTDDGQQEYLDTFKNDQQLNSKIYEIALDQSKSGFSVVKLRRNEANEVFMELIQPSSYFPDYDQTDDYGNPSKVTLASYVTMQDEKGKEQTYLFMEINTIGSIDYEVWLVNKNLKPTKQIPPNSPIYQTIKGDEIDHEETDLDFIPIWQINNTKTSRQDYGKSDFKDISTLIQENNDRLTQISVQLIKHLNAKIAIPQGILDENGNVRVSDLDAIEFGDQGQIPKYITNDNPQIENGFKQIDKLIKFIAAQSKVPSDVLGIDDHKGAEKVEAIKIRLFNTIRKVQRKRTQIAEQLQDVLMAAMKMAGEATEPVQPKIIFEDPLPRDILADTEIVVTRYNTGLISRSTAIKTLDETTQENADAEIELIEAEKAQNALATPNPNLTTL